MNKQKKSPHFVRVAQNEGCCMKLNPDCIRDVMLVLESRSMFLNVDLSLICKRLDGLYERESIAYTLIQLAESGYICMDFKVDKDKIKFYMGKILYITPKGHDFISKISDTNRWKEKIMPLAQKAGAISLYVVEAISKGVMDSVMENLIHQQNTP